MPSDPHPDLRPADASDSEDLLAWRNDQETRANSRSTGPVDAATHQTWLAHALADPNRRLWIAEAAGEKVFTEIGCASCHMADPHETAKGVYSDLCLHDLGPELDAHQPDFLATGADWRTAPLWGLRWKRAYLHDERATTLHDAILAHDGESRAITKRYKDLPEADRASLHRFLQTL